jgi:hypothetical protein
MSKKVKITLGEVISLQTELSNLLAEKLTLSTKMDIQKMITSISKTVEDYQKLRLEFFKTHGKEDKEGNFTLPKNVSKPVIKELEDTLKKEEEIETSLKFDDFKDLTSSYPYYVLFKLF